jgi:ATP-dependent RNA helicase DeaD
MQKVRILEKQVGKKFERKQVPSGKDVCEKQLFSFINKISNVQVDEVQIEQYLPDIYENLQHLDREELIKHFVSVELNRFLDYYKDAKDLNTVVIGNSEFRNRTTGSDRGRRSLSPNYSSREGYSRGNNGYSSGNGEGDRNGSGRRRSYSNEDNEGPRNSRSSERNFRNNDVTFSRFYINVGEKHKMTPPRIIGIINERMQSNEASIGKISIMDKLSAFDIDTRYESDVITAFEDARFENRPLMVELVGNEPPKRTRKKS